MDTQKEYIPVTVDKNHIIAIGERLYTESIEFVREIVNNAYDADASLVEITVSEDSIEINDNGAGMDREGLKQYFNIGSQQKLHTSRSPIYGRDRIGQFGIGKFASLAACERFEVLTKHPLYKRESAKVETHILNLARLITQEIALMKDSKNPRQAFERQSRLLNDAFIEREKVI